jgi:predicted CXXCH cytochrome family protein
MQRPVRTRPVRPKAEGQAAPPGYWRDRLALLLGLVTVVCLGSAFFLAKDRQFLMPGPLTSAHGTIESCSACHSKSGSGQLSWIHGLVAGDPLEDSTACLTCHKMPNTAFNAHGASAEVLKRSTRRLTKIAAATPAPQWARAQSAAFPAHDVVAGGLYCATCHQEHQGVNFSLKKISNELCHSCHVVKFDSFDGHHPKFESYPFNRRTRIIYDHAGHFGKHYPEVAKKGLARRIPATCSACHDSRQDKRLMAVAPFEQTCTACHLGQITGKDRASGPKGIAFLSLPGLDLRTLKRKNAPIGEWPAASEAELTPFMKMMIGRNARGRALIKTVERLNLQDLTDASDDQIEAVTELTWEIKRLFYALIAGKASDVLGDLDIECGAKLSASLVADLTASIPLDVVLSAHQQWLPNLGAEMANRQDTSDQEQSCLVTTADGWVTTITEPKLAVVGVAKDLRIDPQGRLKEREEEAEAPTSDPPRAAPASVEPATAHPPKVDPPKADPPKPEAAQPKAAVGKADTTPFAGKRPQDRAADQTDDLLNLTEEELRDAARPKGPVQKIYSVKIGPDGGTEKHSAGNQKTAQIGGAAPDGGTVNRRPQDKAADQTDDLLNPTEEELRGIAAPVKGAEKGAPPGRAAGKADAAIARPDARVPPDAAPRAAAKVPAAPPAPANAPAATPADSDTAAAEPRAKIAPVISIESDVDPESWAEYGGWYRQDYTIFYRPTGHKDKFVYSWLFLTGPQAPKGHKGPAAAVFDSLAKKDAPGACMKCHSVDDIRGKGRLVNFSPPKVETKQGRFTNFVHEPHFGVLENRGCLACHSLEKGRPYLQSYDHGNPKNFVSNFGAVKKELCQTCHSSSMARQDCLLCHKYHVNGVTTPIMSTKIPIE